MSKASDELERKRLIARWWWTDPARRILQGSDQRVNPAAQVWELLRRTKSYPLLSGQFFSMSDGLGEAILMMFQTRFRRAFGEDMGWLITARLDHAVAWVDLPVEQRRLMESFGPLLPRERKPEESTEMRILFCEIIRQADHEAVSDSVGCGRMLRRMMPSNLKLLPNNTTRQHYIVILFDIRLGEDALARQLDQKLRQLLRIPAEKDLQVVARDNQQSSLISYPPLWRPGSFMSDPCPQATDVMATPSADQPYALCWIPAHHNLKTLLGRFHNQLRMKHRAKLEKQCRRYWKTQREEVATWTGEWKVAPEGKRLLPVYETACKQVYPLFQELPRDLTIRSASLDNIWYGLSAFDEPPRKSGLSTRILFDSYRQDHSPPISALSNTQKDQLLKAWRDDGCAVRKRLQEIDSKFPDPAVTCAGIRADLYKHWSAPAPA